MWIGSRKFDDFQVIEEMFGMCLIIFMFRESHAVDDGEASFKALQ